MTRKKVVEKIEQLRLKIVRIIRNWWHQEEESWSEENPGEESENDIWSSVPKIDSKTVVKALLEIEEKTNIKVNEEKIKKGGYESIDELLEDLVPKILDTNSGSNSN